MNKQYIESGPHDMRNEAMKHGFIFIIFYILSLTPIVLFIFVPFLAISPQQL